MKLFYLNPSAFLHWSRYAGTWSQAAHSAALPPDAAPEFTLPAAGGVTAGTPNALISLNLTLAGKEKTEASVDHGLQL